MTSDSLISERTDAAVSRPDEAAKACAKSSPATASARTGALPPAIILGGEANALSVARDLGRVLGVRVYLLLEEPDSPVRWSRYGQTIQIANDGPSSQSSAPPGVGNKKAELAELWARFLLGAESDYLRGSVLLTCSDTGIEVLSRHREKLLEKYLLDIAHPAGQLALLDKLSTYQIARQAGVPTPRFWEVASKDEALALQSELVFPLMVKPRLSHIFQEIFGRKFMIVSGIDELLAAFEKASGAGLEVLLMEQIPGPDSALCSYYPYLDEHGEPLFHFTKRIIRRYPVGMGTASYHVTDWIPEIVPLGIKLFRQAGVRGLANVEFKFDSRDNTYKLIECNARFNASNCLASASGFNFSQFVYNRAAARAVQPLQTYQSGIHLLDPVRDFLAFRELRAAGQITLWQWLAGLLHRQTMFYFALTDPLPAVARGMRPIGRLFRRAGRK